MPSLPASLPRICVALGLDSASGLSRALEHEYRDGSTFFEFRLDYMSQPEAGLDVIRKVRARNPDLRVIATCRHKQHSGGFEGTVEQQMAVLRNAVEAGATAIDVEIETAECAPLEIAKLRELAPVIVSYHNFEHTPALSPLFRKLQRVPADVYKIATTARKPSDNLRLIEFARHHRGSPLVALAMSELGTVTRVLAPALGSKFTYASPCGAEGTAAGQIPARVMRSLYRADKLTKDSRIYGVIAEPVAHSKSPLIHNRAFQARRIDAVYIPFLVSPGQLGDFMELALELPVSGFSVTIPHKQRIMRHLDVVDPLARRVGAVNTVWRKRGQWRGTNTDTQGVLKPLSRHLRLPHASILIAGYGGAARAAAIALADAGAKITITGRNAKSAEMLAHAVRGEAMTIPEARKRRFDVLVHATPVGMWPKTDETVFPDTIPAQIVMDMIYNPHDTLLLKRAAEQGCTVIHGSEMLIEQAACQFEIWTGEQAPRAVMQSAYEQHI